VRSAAGIVGSRDRRIPLHTPLRWREPVPGHARRRLPAGAYPRRSFRMVANGQPSTDHEDLPGDQRPSGLLLPPERRNVWSQLLGLTLRSRTGENYLALHNALTRVDVACRYVGNEECW
jgi:hypothetical protein